MDNSLLISITILVLIMLLFVLVAIKGRKVDRKKRERLVKEVLTLEKGTRSEELAVRRDSIIKLDNLLSKSFQIYFNNNLTCGENLKKADTLFRKRQYNTLWETHKLRNKVVHDDYAVSKEETLRAYGVYKRSIIKILQ
jgi:uncharacterized protein YutE (UPF0331/DUF86 family)